jgi:hypothetical protein
MQPGFVQTQGAIGQYRPEFGAARKSFFVPHFSP